MSFANISSDDAQFLNDFEAGVIEKAAFKHRDHLRLAWILLSVCDADEARKRVERGIRAFATLHGVPGLFHATVTEAWIRLVAEAKARGGDEQHPQETSEPPAPLNGSALPAFDDWLAGHPELCDGGLLGRYYSEAVLRSDLARATWVDPDLAPLPAIGAR